jgi:acyl transferase domain-containing protein
LFSDLSGSSARSAKLKDRSYSESDIAIVSYGAVLPDALNAEDFWKNLRQGKSSIKPISEDRWKKNSHYSPYRELDDKTYSFFGAEISHKEYKNLAKKHGIDEKTDSRLDVLAFESVGQALQSINPPADPSRWGLILGVMNPDESHYFSKCEQNKPKLIRQLREHSPAEWRESIPALLDHYLQLLLDKCQPSVNNLLIASTIARVQGRYNILGDSFCVDAACASSLASIDLAAKRLLNDELDLAIVGGLESNLSPGAYTLFSKVGALALEQCLPMDRRSDGLSQGEGAVVFVLQRLKDALADGHSVSGIVRACQGSSDGRVTSLFQPNVVGQSIAYGRAYKSLEDRSLDYLELHGTGTKVGDSSEAQSVSQFFNEKMMPVGSSKYFVGHTKSTAGATGLLRCLLSMRERIIPASPYFEKPVIPSLGQAFVNKSEIKLSPRQRSLRMAVSSFGFGGCNYHLVVDNFPAGSPVRSDARKPLAQRREMVLLGEATLGIEEFDAQWFLDKSSIYRLPPKSIKKIDRTQLLAIKTVERAMEKAGLSFDRLNRESISVISASTEGLDIIDQMANRMTMDCLIGDAMVDLESGKGVADELKEFIRILEILKLEYDPLSEDSGPGILNNVIAGRVCNAFNLKGPNYNIDHDQASISCALSVIQTEIDLGLDQLTILIGVHEKVEPESYKIRRSAVSCYLLSSLDFAKQEMLQVQRVYSRGSKHA